MKQETLLLILGLTPLALAAVIAAANSGSINNSTEIAEAWVRRKRAASSPGTGWFRRFLINPVLWGLVQFSNWTDNFAHRGLKNGVRVAAALYLVMLWCFILYLAFMATLVIVISLIIIYVAHKIIFTMLLNADPDFKKGFNLGRNILGAPGKGKRINQLTGIVQEKGLFGWNDTDQKIDPETGKIAEKGLFGWNETGTKIDQETGLIQKQGLFGYTDTDIRINPESGIFQKKGILGWDDTNERIDPASGRHLKKGLLGWEDV